jgi:hypothetical protein
MKKHASFSSRIFRVCPEDNVSANMLYIEVAPLGHRNLSQSERNLFILLDRDSQSADEKGGLNGIGWKGERGTDSV